MLREAERTDLTDNIMSTIFILFNVIVTQANNIIQKDLGEHMDLRDERAHCLHLTCVH